MTPTRLMTCSLICASGLRADNAHGAIYGPYVVETDDDGNSRSVGRMAWAAISGRCIYDNAPLPRGRQRRILAWMMEHPSPDLEVVAYHLA